MTAPDAILVPAGTGDRIVREALAYARNIAAKNRARNWTERESHLIGLLIGQILIAELHLHADRMLCAEAEQEINKILDPRAMPSVAWRGMR